MLVVSPFFSVFPSKKISLSTMNWCSKATFLRLLLSSVIMSKHFMTCASSKFCIHLYASKTVRDHFLFSNSTANPRGIKKRFSSYFNKSFYYLHTLWSHFFSNLLSLPDFILFTLKFMT